MKVGNRRETRCADAVAALASSAASNMVLGNDDGFGSRTTLALGDHCLSQ